MKKVQAIISGTGRYLPERILTNHDFEKFLDTSDEWITTRTGIKTRHIADDSQATADLAYYAAERAIKNAGIDKNDINLIIVATFTPHMPLPSTACFVQEKLGIEGCGAFDISAACSGFVYGLSIATQFIKGGIYKNVLLIGAETMSRFTDYKDRGSCILFGDGAGAVVISAEENTDERGIFYTKLAADGKGWPLLHIPAGGSLKPASAETVENREHYIKLKGREIYKFAVQKMQSLIEDAIKENNLTIEDIKMIVPHQVNKRITDSACEHIGFPTEKVFLNISQVGNTSAASIPIALDQAIEEGKITKGDIVLMVAFGAGLTWASALLKL